MGYTRSSGSQTVLKKQAMGHVNETPPTSGVYYTLLDTTIDARVLLVAIRHKSDEAGAKDITIKFTIDGQTIEQALTGIADDTWKYIYKAVASDTFWDSATYYNLGGRCAYEAHSIKIEVKLTTAVGTNQELEAVCHYSTRESA